MKRHDLIFVSPAAWRAVLATRPDLTAEPLVASWVDNGWPLVGRRATFGELQGEMPGIAVGLPLPPSAGKRRLSFVIQPEDIVSISPPPSLSAASRVAPSAWWATLDSLEELAAQHAVVARVFGSLAWQAITGLNYLTDGSDLDLLLYVRRHMGLLRLAAGIAAVEAEAPMRIDGELIRDDGAAVNWREFYAGADEILVKSAGGVALLDTGRFLSGQAPP